MNTIDQREDIASVSQLLQEELRCYRLMHALAQDRSRAIRENDFSRLGGLVLESERLKQKIQGLERKLETFRSAGTASGSWASGETNALWEMVGDIHEEISKILILESRSFEELSEKHSVLKQELLEISKKDELNNYYAHKDYAPARFISIST